MDASWICTQHWSEEQQQREWGYSAAHRPNGESYTNLAVILAYESTMHTAFFQHLRLCSRLFRSGTSAFDIYKRFSLDHSGTLRFFDSSSAKL